MSRADLKNPQSCAWNDRSSRSSWTLLNAPTTTSLTPGGNSEQPARVDPKPCIPGCHPRGPVARAFGGKIPQDFAFFDVFDLLEPLRTTAWRTSALKADSSTSSPSWMSIARRVFPSRLELKRRAGSLRDAPLAKVSFTILL